jgi:Heavy metal associated domain 2
LEGIEIIESRPGQLTLALAKMKHNQTLAREVEDGFSAIRGIHRVEADSNQGTVSIDYDQRQLTSLRFLLKLKETFSSLFPEISASKLATWLSRTL